MKFTFPNKHSVYMHDTQSKGLFGEAQRTFSHGCVRVKNPQRLAEVLLGIDKGWSAEEVDELLKGDPEENGVPLNHHIPVHITYFTAQVDDGGEVTTEEGRLRPREAHHAGPEGPVGRHRQGLRSSRPGGDGAALRRRRKLRPREGAPAAAVASSAAATAAAVAVAIHSASSAAATRPTTSSARASATSASRSD